MSVALWLFGAVRLRIPAEERVAAMNLCLENSIPYRNFCYGEEGSVSFSVTPVTARRFRHLCRERGLSVEVIGASGIPFFLFSLRRRPGLALGLPLGLCLLFLSGFFVWDIEVTGNQTLTAGEVRELLEEASFGVGSFIPGVEIRDLENRVLMTSSELSWIAVNLSGTVARVQVIERRALPQSEEDASRPANLIAACDGQIEFLQLYRGAPVVTVGQAVKKGELLVSGIYDSGTVGFRYTRAAGEVMARTEHTYRIEIPLAKLEKHYEETACRSVTLHFFNFSWEIFKNTGNQSSSCDIIKKDKVFSWFGTRPLPFFLTVTSAQTYAEREIRRTPEEALEAAYAALEEELEARSGELRLLEKRITTEMNDTALVLTCTVSCIENIAVPSEFEIRE